MAGVWQFVCTDPSSLRAAIQKELSSGRLLKEPLLAGMRHRAVVPRTHTPAHVLVSRTVRLQRQPPFSRTTFGRKRSYLL